MERKPQEAWAVRVVRTGKINLDSVKALKADAKHGYRYMLEIGNCELVRVIVTAKP